ncbi:stalk domain-containing protein [Paenibacillus sp. IITD108]|uniref:stalk domain-containing protein n=1 Tax=Paenibacillus sp. IITD108 TaxID=3116649 RepID=UPI002F4009E3
MRIKISILTLAVAWIAGMLAWAPSTSFAANSAGLDSGLEAAIREQLALNEKVLLTTDEITLLTSLVIESEHNVKSLNGLKDALFLAVLDIEGNKPIDISVLRGLRSLQLLTIDEEVLDSTAIEIIKSLEGEGVDVTITSKEPDETQPIEVFIDGELVHFTKDPVIINGTTMVQFRPIFESFGLEVGWNAESRTVSGAQDRLLIELIIGSKLANVSGTELNLPVAPMLKDGNTMIPLRFIGEATGRRVLWDGESRTIDIDSSITSYNLGIIYSNKTAYEGEVANGIPNGKGKLIHDGELFFEGQFKNGKIEGIGKMYDIDNPKSYYEGNFQNNRFHGDGKLIYDDGGYHVGSYDNGMREGNGKLYSGDGKLSYSGMFKLDALHGAGTGYYNSYKYVGEYAFGSFNGQGKLSYQDQLIYDGTWVDGLRDQGKIFYEGKLNYEGTFWKDRPHGYGNFYDEQGKLTYRGQIHTYQKMGVGIIYYADGKRYIGEVFDGLPDGFGLLKDAKGSIIFTGYFVDGEIDEDPSATAQSTDAAKKLLSKKSRHYVIDGYYSNDLGLTPKQAAMYIFLNSEEDLNIYNNLPKDVQKAFINEYAQRYWGDVIGVDECFTYIAYGSLVYASAVLSYEMENEQVELSSFPKGKEVIL